LRTPVILSPLLIFALLAGNSSVLSASRLVDRILAVVNDEVISLSDVQTYRSLFSQNRDVESVLDEMIDQKLLLSEARKFNLETPPEARVEEEIQTLSEAFGGPAALSDMLNRIIMSEEKFRELIRIRLTVSLLLEQRIHSFIFVSGQEIEDYYQAHTESFGGRSLEETRHEITAQITLDKADSRKEEYLERLRKRAVIQVN
jgi:parvulin-like peptidyl-prolyl isomerase